MSNTNTNEKQEKGLKARLARIKNAQSSIPFPVVIAILALAAVLEIAFCVLVLSLGILPAQYVALIIAVLLAIDVGLFMLLTSRRKSSRRFTTGLILTVALMILLLPMAYFLNTTGDALKKIASAGEQWEEYDVVCLKDGSYETVADIRGKTVYAHGSKAKMNVEAKERLVTKADVEFKDEKDLMSLGYRLVDEQGKAQDNVIFVSESLYEMQCENIEDFEKQTKVIYKIDVKKRSQESAKINVTEDPFNVYITGIDAWGDIDNVSRSDVNMIVTVNPQTRQILLTSIPRDSYVPLHSYGEMDKLTHSGIYGVDETLDTVEDWLGVDLNYYVKINFSMVVDIVNAIGGIEVYNDQAFGSAISKYYYPKGKVTLHGKSTLYFARERKSFKESDEQRVKNQQKVMQAIIEKVTSSKVIMSSYTDLLAIVADHMKTNMSDRDMAALARMQLSDMDTKWTIDTVSIDCDGAMMGTFSMGMGRELFVAVPKEESVKKAVDKIHDVMYPAEVETESLEDLME